MLSLVSRKFLAMRNIALYSVWTEIFMQVHMYTCISNTYNFIQQYVCMALTKLEMNTTAVTFLGSKWMHISSLNLYAAMHVYKSVNLKYNTLVCWADGTNDSLTKRLMFQVLFFFTKSCKILCKNYFKLFLVFLHKFKKIKSFDCPKSIRNYEKNT